MTPQESEQILNEIDEKLGKAGYHCNGGITTSVGLLIYDRDSAVKECEKLKGEIEYMKRNEREWKEDWKAEVSAMGCEIKRLTKERDEAKQHASVVLTTCQKTVARDTASHESELARALRAYHLECEAIKDSHEAELARVLTDSYGLTIEPNAFLRTIKLSNRFKWDGSRFVPKDNVVDANKKPEPSFIDKIKARQDGKLVTVDMLVKTFRHHGYYTMAEYLEDNANE